MEDVVERLRDGVVLVLVTLCKRVHYLSVAVGDDGVFFYFSSISYPNHAQIGQRAK